MDGDPPCHQDNFLQVMYPLNQDTAGAGVCLVHPQPSCSQGCSRKSWATSALEDHRSHLLGDTVLPGPSPIHCLQNPGELSPTSTCLLLAFPVGLVRLPRFQLPRFCNQIICVSASLGDGCSSEAVLQEFSNTEGGPDGIAQVSEGMSSLHSTV